MLTREEIIDALRRLRSGVIMMRFVAKDNAELCTLASYVTDTLDKIVEEKKNGTGERE